MTDNEHRTLYALALMASQYLTSQHDSTLHDNQAMSAGESAFEILALHGLIEIESGTYRFARWTPTGIELLGSDAVDSN